jgi:hypothetical protein
VNFLLNAAVTNQYIKVWRLTQHHSAPWTSSIW